LQLEEDTPLGINPPDSIPGDDIQAESFFRTKKILEQSGFLHYEISNFAKPGFECLHNINYWNCGEYIGLGPGASSHLQGVRFKNKSDLHSYLHDPAGQAEFEECLDGQAKLRERAMLGLRLVHEGLALDEDMLFLKPVLDGMVNEGDLEFDGNRYKIQPNRLYVSNPIFAKVLGI
jgi:oxygen-independent coproporphyrinogen-3 oxidase